MIQAVGTALSALTQALYETEMVAVVRRVYRANSTPSLGTLVPVIQQDNMVGIFVNKIL